MARKPAIQTKAGNYLLRSTRRDNLLDLMALVHAGRIAVGQVNSHVTKRDGSWAGHAPWGTRTLEDRGLIRRSQGASFGRRWFELTTEGHRALDGALAALDRRIDTAALLAEIDARRIY
jgi:hypothetical protein